MRIQDLDGPSGPAPREACDDSSEKGEPAAGNQPPCEKELAGARSDPVTLLRNTAPSLKPSGRLAIIATDAEKFGSEGAGRARRIGKGARDVWFGGWLTRNSETAWNGSLPRVA